MDYQGGAERLRRIPWWLDHGTVGGGGGGGEDRLGQWLASELTSQVVAVRTSRAPPNTLPHTSENSGPLSNIAAPESIDRGQRIKAG